MEGSNIIYWMRDNKISNIYAEFSGGGDSGSFTSILYKDVNDKNIYPFAKTKNKHLNKVDNIINALLDIDETSIYMFLDDLLGPAGDWYNNEGGQGNIKVYNDGKYELEWSHNHMGNGIGEEDEFGDYDEYEVIEGDSKCYEGQIDLSE